MIMMMTTTTKICRPC